MATSPKSPISVILSLNYCTLRPTIELILFINIESPIPISIPIQSGAILRIHKLYTISRSYGLFSIIVKNIFVKIYFFINYEFCPFYRETISNASHIKEKGVGVFFK